jgi:osmoprotectant transport system substrate-binding protein
MGQELLARIASFLNYVDTTLGTVLIISATLGQIRPKTVRLFDILKPLFKNWPLRAAAIVLILAIILVFITNLPALRLVFLTIIGICVLYMVITLFGPARRDLYPTADNPKRTARFKKSRVVVGGKEFIEQSILCELVARVIEIDNPELDVRRRFRLDGTLDAYHELQQGEIDLYVEYTGTALFYLLKLPIEEVRSKKEYELNDLFRDQNLIWLDALGFNNAYVMVMMRQKAESLGITNISELSRISRDLRFRGTKEFSCRPDGLPGLQQRYELYFKSDDIVLIQNRYRALRNKEMDVTSGFLTDPEINLEGDKFIKLKDDKQFFPTYYAKPFVHRDLIACFPGIETSLRKLAGLIDEEEMAQLIRQGNEKNLNSKQNREGLEALVSRFLREKGI